MKRTSVAVLLALGIGLLWMPAAMAGENRVNLLCTPDPAWCEAVKREFSKSTGV